MSERIKLTKRVVDAQNSTGRDFFIWDSEIRGFGVRIRKSGKKIFIVQYRNGTGRGAKQRRLSLGTYGVLTVEQARKAAQTVLAKVLLGEDPCETQSYASKFPTIGDIADRWLKEVAPRSRMRGKRMGELRDPKNIALDRSRIERHIKPLIGKVPLDKLSSRVIAKFRDDVASGKTAVVEKTGPHGLARVTGGEGAATRTLRQLSSILSFAVREGIIAENPAFGIARTPDKKCERYLSESEIQRLGEVLDEQESETVFNQGIWIIRLLLLTGCRKSEIESLKWSEVDLQRSFIRFERSKTGAKIILLTRGACELFCKLPRFNNSPWVFPSSRNKRHYVNTPKVWQDIRKKASLEDVRLHDLRHTFASIAASGGLSLPIIGALLGHTQSSTTARYAHLADRPLRWAAEEVGSKIDQALAGKKEDVY